MRRFVTFEFRPDDLKPFMALNLIKLCVGAESVEDQRMWGEMRLQEMRRSGVEACLSHTTRMMPKRAEELLDGGSLYWVIKGKVQARQKLIEIRRVTDSEGINRCKLMLDSELIATQWQPKRAFQGWRYFNGDEVPDDLDGTQATIPPQLKAELAELGLL